MTRAKPETRIALQLDPRIALEAIILNRLERAPARRRQEWLRSLLLAGFRSECQVVKRSTELPSRRGTIPVSTWNPQTLRSSIGPRSDRQVDVGSQEPDPSVENKPFAMLARVIGHDAAEHRALIR